MPDDGGDVRAPPFETAGLRRQLAAFLNQRIADPISGAEATLGNYKFGVYAFFDYDGEPIYVGQTNERLRARIRRHLTNQRTDAVAMNVLDPFEVFEIEVWPLAQYEDRAGTDPIAKHHLDWLEYQVFQKALDQSHFKAVLNEKDPLDVSGRVLATGASVADTGFAIPPSWRGTVVGPDVHSLRRHPDTRIARRAGTLALLAKVISERQVQVGLRRTLLTQAKRLAWLAERRLGELAGEVDTPEDGVD